MVKKSDMTHIEKLDKILEFITINDENRSRHSKTIYQKFENIIPENEIPLIIEKLEKDGFIKKSIIENPNNSKLTPPYACLLTYDGYFFFEKGGYKTQKKRILWESLKTKTKTIVIVLNSIIILIIAAFGVYYTYESKEKDKVISDKEKKIEILSSTVDSLKKIRPSEINEKSIQKPNR
jgi:hypothetical protein